MSLTLKPGAFLLCMQIVVDRNRFKNNTYVFSLVALKVIVSIYLTLHNASNDSKHTACNVRAATNSLRKEKKNKNLITLFIYTSEYLTIFFLLFFIRKLRFRKYVSQHVTLGNTSLIRTRIALNV